MTGDRAMRPERIEFTDGLPVKAFVRRSNQLPYHWHDALEIVQVLKGSVNISMGDDDLLLRESDIAVVNMGELHRITKSHEDNELLFLHIDDSFCRSVLPDSGYFFIFCCSAYHEAEAPEKYETLKKSIARLVNTLNENNPLNDKRTLNKKHHKKFAETVEDILTAMLNYLTYNFDFLRWGYGTTPFTEKLVERLKQIADLTSSDIEVQMRLKELAAETGVSLQHLSYDIKNKFGLTFQELLYYGRCAHAAKLLLGTDRRIIDIALECGFSDVKYFIKHFRKNFQYTPSAFRKMYQADGAALASQTQYLDCPFPDAII